MESDSKNVISWESLLPKFLKRLQFYFNEIESLVSSLDVKFQHVGRLAKDCKGLYICRLSLCNCF